MSVFVEVDLVKAVTNRAALCVIDGDEHWLPLSQCDEGGWSPDQGDEDVTVEIPEWLAREKGLD